MNNKYYEILGLEPNATQDDIKKAWKKKSMEWHPDRNQSEEAKEKMQEINEAYEILIGKKKTTEENIKNNFYENVRRGFNRFKVRPIVINLNLTVEECFSGVEKTIEYNIYRSCNVCNGNGGDLKTCDGCGGKGVKKTIYNGIHVVMNCNVCNGSGSVKTNLCKNCHGHGVKQVIESIKIKIPRGIVNDSKLVVQNGGNDIPNHIRGDLFINITLIPHDTYKVEGLNIHQDVLVSFVDMVLGTTKEINTLSGLYKIKIEPHTESNKILRLKGLGLFDEENNIKGDLYVKLVVNVPKNISNEERVSLEKLKEFISFL
jgi:molecular chaperone DnaJ